MSDPNIKVELNDSKKKNINLKNVNSLSGVKVVRQREPSISSESSYSESGSDSGSSSGYSSESSAPKKTKKILRKKTFHQEAKNDYNAFSNPKKMVQRDSDDSGSEYSDISESNYSDSGSEQSVDNEKKNWEERQRLKQDLLIKIQALEAKGFEFSKKFTMSSNYDDMLYEYEKIKKFLDTQAGIKVCRRFLMAAVTGIEHLNRSFDPFNIKLNGWSENVMESVDEYDNVFERLLEKYGSKAEMAPELELLLALGGSAFMFHLTNVMAQGLSGLSSGNPIAQNNPNFMASMMSTVNQAMKQANKPPNFSSGPGFPAQQQQSSFPAPMETRGQRREMRGPSMDPNLFNGTPLSNHPNQVNATPPAPVWHNQGPQMYNNGKTGRNYYEEDPIDDDDRFSLSSDSSFASSESSVQIKKIVTKKKGKKGGLELNIS
jgi:hypothetical protein